MPLHWTFDSPNRLVTVVADGDCSRADVEAYLAAVEAEGAVIWRKLVDARAARPTMSPEDTLALGVAMRTTHARGPVGALAIVVPPDTAEHFMHFLGTLATADRPMRVFREIARARRWIEGLPG